MSRCFPFTPRGSAGKCSASNNDALIDSIKVCYTQQTNKNAKVCCTC
ncbi:hypothetical protein BVRB_3g067090 isoform C [Beta vulgaris subsp. vulgaris]|nr:hypothetical protein BVRB_3g067090 isoform C [Beta vulgaris subsp. vulgaris]